MKWCRFNHDRLGLVQGEEILDVTDALDVLPALQWPYPQGDQLIAHLDQVHARAQPLIPTARRVPLHGASLKSPVANPSKILNAPINYRAHVEEAKDPAIAHGRDLDNKTPADWGLFLTANSSLIGCGEDILLRWPERRNDHELELVIVIGKSCSHVSRANALHYVAGYMIGLDMTIRGPELPSFRKSADTYTVCGPWLTTADEVANPDNLDLLLQVNGHTRQDTNTHSLVFGVAQLIEYASSMYTLLPGDLIFTGTPAGVGPVQPGDAITASIQQLGGFTTHVAKQYSLPAAQSQPA
ncbi:MAG: fumarylacetoacetate hydrolase family protein [Pigmentiphaga sp.]